MDLILLLPLLLGLSLIIQLEVCLFYQILKIGFYQFFRVPALSTEHAVVFRLFFEFLSKPGPKSAGAQFFLSTVGLEFDFPLGEGGAGLAFEALIVVEFIRSSDVIDVFPEGLFFFWLHQESASQFKPI